MKQLSVMLFSYHFVKLRNFNE